MVGGSIDGTSVDHVPESAPAELAPVDHALEQVSLGVDHLVKLLEDGGLDALDNSRLVSFMQGFERIRNRMPLADHRMIMDAERRNLPDTLTQPSMTRVLMAALRLSAAETTRSQRRPHPPHDADVIPPGSERSGGRSGRNPPQQPS